MKWTSNEISVERLLEQDIPQLVRYHKDIVMLNNFGDLSLFAHPVRLKATIVLVCLKGVIDCSINLHQFLITENQIFVSLAGDIIHINKAESIEGYAIIISKTYLQHIQLDFRYRAQSYLNLRDNGPVSVPYEELTYLKPYYVLLKKNMEEGNDEVIKGLSIALSYTITTLLKKYQGINIGESEKDESRIEQLFNKFMKLLEAYHTKERSLQFYADKMCLTPKYVSGAIKSFQGNSSKLQPADYQLTAIFFYHICTTFAQQNYKIPFKIHRHSPSFTTVERFCIFLTTHHSLDAEQSKPCRGYRDCEEVSGDHSRAEARPYKCGVCNISPIGS